MRIITPGNLLTTCALLLALVSTSVWADHLNRSADIDGVKLYLGIVSAEDLLRNARVNPTAYPAHEIPKAPDMFHVIVVLIDKATGARIRDAKVIGRISPLALFGQEKIMRPMVTAGAVNYCEFFQIPSNDQYTIDLQITRPNYPNVLVAHFDHKRLE